MTRQTWHKNVLRASARMLQVVAGERSAAEFTGPQEDTASRMISVWLKSTNDIVALGCAALDFEHFEIIERPIIASFRIATPLLYVGSLLYFHGVGASTGPIYQRVAGGNANTLRDTQSGPAWTRLFCSPRHLAAVMEAFDKADQQTGSRR
jgi:hypothetical protein